MFFPRKMALARTVLLCLLAFCLRPVIAGDCPPPLQAPTPEVLQRMQSEARDRGFLWQIEKDGRVSWLYGSVHVGKEDWAIPGPQIMSALRQSEVVALEMDPLDPAIQQKMAALLSQGADQIPEELKPRVEKLLDTVCLPATLMAQMHPAFLFATVEMLALRERGLEASYGVEMMLSAMAHASGKAVVSMETPERQVYALIGPELSVSDSDLTEALEASESEKNKLLAQRMIDSWANSDLNELANFFNWCECLTTPMQRKVMTRLLDERNQDLADSIDGLHKDGKSVFAAVGSLHMAGAIGLPNLLKQKGYRVTRTLFSAGREILMSKNAESETGGNRPDSIIKAE